MGTSRVTLKDIAQRAGVSISTASRVVRGDRSRPVDTTTEERILDAVRALDYRPNLVARALVSGTGGPISPAREVGIVLGTTSYKFSDPFFSRVIDGIDAEILANRRHLRFVYSQADLSDSSILYEMVRPDVIGGLIGVALRADALRFLLDTGVRPIVVVEGPEPMRGVDFVSCDKEGAIAQLMEHLWHLGHRHFAYLGALEEERATRFRAWTALAGARAVVIDTHNGWDREAGYEAMRRLLTTSRETRPTAVVASCDGVAVGALRAAREGHVAIPGELALVGFDDTMGAFTNPPLTSVAVQREQLGQLAVRRLLQRQLHPDEPFVRIIEATQLVVRESCGMGPGREEVMPTNGPEHDTGPGEEGS
jgi:LacI family transcriptional regulator